MWEHVFSKFRSQKSQRGAAALEFALVFPVLLLLLVGIVDFGMLMGAQTQVANAAREGGRAGALTGMQSEAESAARSAISSMPGASNAGTHVNVTCTMPNGSACSMIDTTPDTGGMVTVTVTYVHTWLSPTVLSLSPTITLTGQSKMRIEA